MNTPNVSDPNDQGPKSDNQDGLYCEICDEQHDSEDELHECERENGSDVASNIMRVQQETDAAEPNLELTEEQDSLGYKCEFCSGRHLFVQVDNHVWIPDNAGIACLDAKAAAEEPDLSLRQSK